MSETADAIKRDVALLASVICPRKDYCGLCEGIAVRMLAKSGALLDALAKAGVLEAEMLSVGGHRLMRRYVSQWKE